MKKTTIYYMSDVKWFSKLTSEKYNSKIEMLKAHIDYIKKNAVVEYNDASKIFEYASMADKRANSRIALSFNFALPNDINNVDVKVWIEQVVEVIATVFNTDKDKIYAGLHNEENNKHIHVVVANLNKQNKALRINRNELQTLHKELQNLILSNGYEIKKNTHLEEEHIGTILRYDEEIRQLYEDYRKAKEEFRKIIELADKLQRERLEKEKKEKEEENISIQIDLSPNKNNRRRPGPQI